ncbi:hypothetical protein CAOG_02195 [Capsaspora owczarzaki ATCC 30864]|uniref:hypothetical protein n=1 Tax=Capsaspora owczarzaki (strain ATCC 30864) TaxID=595528 RepID=UPI0001FE32B5|nr:hypothetical protein CAOG_02195 [Capsaspora owczarzaki ATCC 30864]|eukprot:XP_004348945.1 hypothetical protein CAOG_02195 [Capsaspora owczarzaki ATCC 30864]
MLDRRRVQRSASAATEPKPKGAPARLRTPDEWSKLSDKDLDRIADQMAEDDYDEEDARDPRHPRTRRARREAEEQQRAQAQAQQDVAPPTQEEIEAAMRAAGPGMASRVQDVETEQILRQSKKNQAVMVAVRTVGPQTTREMDDLMARWQLSLKNAHIDSQRYTIKVGHGVLMILDGYHAWDARDYLVQQPELDECSFESRQYKGVRHGDDSFVHQRKLQQQQHRQAQAAAKSKSEARRKARRQAAHGEL